MDVYQELKSTNKPLKRWYYLTMCYFNSDKLLRRILEIEFFKGSLLSKVGIAAYKGLFNFKSEMKIAKCV